MAHTHRTVMMGLATAPLAAAATASSPDPTFDVIEWYRRLLAVLEATDEKADPGLYAVAADELGASGRSDATAR